MLIQSTWFFDEKIEQVYEPAQQATDGKLDLNSSFVVSKKSFQRNKAKLTRSYIRWKLIRFPLHECTDYYRANT